MRLADDMENDPVADHSPGVLQGFEPMPVRALFLQCPDDPFHHAVLLGRVRMGHREPQWAFRLKWPSAEK